jgi:hypothetical protein
MNHSNSQRHRLDAVKALLDGGVSDANDREINRGVREARDDGRTEEERWILAEEMLSEQGPCTIQASPPLPLSYILGSYAVAWRVEGEDGEWQWMPYCAGRRRPGEEEESDF